MRIANDRRGSVVVWLMAGMVIYISLGLIITAIALLGGWMSLSGHGVGEVFAAVFLWPIYFFTCMNPQPVFAGVCA